MIIALAWRNIWRNPVRSIVIIISVAAGLFAAIAVLSLYNGMLDGRLNTVIYSETGHIQAHQRGFGEDMEPGLTLGQPTEWRRQLEQDTAIRTFTMRVVGSGMLSTATGSSGVRINGVDIRKELVLSGFNKKLLAGSPGMKEAPETLLNDQRSLVIGRKLATKLKLDKGDKVVLTMTDTGGNLVSTAMRIKAVYQSVNAPLDEINVYVRDEALAKLLGVPGHYHELVVLLKRSADVENVRSRLQKAFPDARVETWNELSPESELMVNTINVYSYIIVIIILIALSFGIVNTMLMSVLERRKEIGMMAALGTGRRKLLMMIFTETIFLSTVGVPLALGISWLIVDHYHSRGLDLSGMGEELMKSFGYESLIFPAFPADKLPGIIALVFLSALLASIYPSFKSIRINPAEALKK
jgi:ABC-type lipoprotein release transport system permease subunit